MFIHSQTSLCASAHKSALRGDLLNILSPGISAVAWLKWTLCHPFAHETSFSFLPQLPHFWVAPLCYQFFNQSLRKAVIQDELKKTPVTKQELGNQHSDRPEEEDRGWQWEGWGRSGCCTEEKNPLNLRETEWRELKLAHQEQKVSLSSTNVAVAPSF